VLAASAAHDACVAANGNSGDPQRAAGRLGETAVSVGDVFIVAPPAFPVDDARFALQPAPPSNSDAITVAARKRPAPLRTVIILRFVPGDDVVCLTPRSLDERTEIAMADSQTLTEFKRLAGIGSWDQAFTYCNGLSMYEMLRGLAAISGEGLLIMKRTAPSYAGRLGWERIAFAIGVVGEGKIGTFPGMGTSDKTDAQNFLNQKKSAPASAGSVADAGRAVKAGLASGTLQDPKRELAAALTGSGPLYVSNEIILLLASLIQGGNTVKLISLLRPNNGPHGIPISDTEYLSQAVDIGYFNGLINVQTSSDNKSYVDPEAPFRTHTAVLGVLSRLPRLSGLTFGIGAPRATNMQGGPDCDESLRLYLGNPDKGAAKGIPSLKEQFSYKGKTLTVRSEIQTAINHSPAGRVAWFNGDGRDHIHVQVERRGQPKEVYAAARYKP
jgi:hypothetical protein